MSTVLRAARALLNSWQPLVVLSGGASTCLGAGATVTHYTHSFWPGLAVTGALSCVAALRYGSLVAIAEEPQK